MCRRVIKSAAMPRFGRQTSVSILCWHSKIQLFIVFQWAARPFHALAAIESVGFAAAWVGVGERCFYAGGT